MVVEFSSDASSALGSSDVFSATGSSGLISGSFTSIFTVICEFLFKIGCILPLEHEMLLL